MLIALWWNPVVWLWCRSLKEIHEFQADRAVLQRGFDSEQYIYLIVKSAAGMHPEFVSGFSYSLLKKRLIMLTKNQPTRRRAWRLATAVPVLGVLMLLFSFARKAPQPVETPAADLPRIASNVSTPVPGPSLIPTQPPASDDDAPFIAVDEMPKFEGEGDLSTFRNWVMSQIQYSPIAEENRIQGRVTLQFVIERDGSVSNITVLNSPDRMLGEEAVRVIALSSKKWTPGKKDGESVRVRFVIPVDFSLN
jgi:TonB family protein